MPGKEEQLLSQFYRAFKKLDAETMVACYHKQVVFEDPAFGQLHGEHAGNMWRMLCQSQRDKGFKLNFSVVEATEKTGLVKWDAQYTFSRTGRHVHNFIEGRFAFQDGLIIQHTDQFNLHRWAHQALGLSGTLLGWTPFFKKRFQQQTHRLLASFESKRTNN